MRVLSWLAVLLLAFPSLSRAGSDPAAKTAYLQFRVVRGHLEAAGVQVVPGKLKMPRQVTPIAGCLQVDVFSADNRLLWSRVIPDPTQVRYEYVDEAGRLQSRTEVRDSVEFYVRVPYSPVIRRASFMRIVGVTATGTATKAVTEAMGSVGVRVEAADD